MFCDQVMPAKTAGSSLRSDSIGHLIKGKAIINNAMSRPGRRFHRE
jgi:hypothetical protein